MLSAPILGGLPNSLSQTRQRRAMNAIGSQQHAHCRDRRSAVGGCNPLHLPFSSYVFRRRLAPTATYG